MIYTKLARMSNMNSQNCGLTSLIDYIEDD